MSLRQEGKEAVTLVLFAVLALVLIVVFVGVGSYVLGTFKNTGVINATIVSQGNSALQTISNQAQQVPLLIVAIAVIAVVFGLVLWLYNRSEGIMGGGRV